MASFFISQGVGIIVGIGGLLLWFDKVLCGTFYRKGRTGTRLFQRNRALAPFQT